MPDRKLEGRQALFLENCCIVLVGTEVLYRMHGQNVLLLSSIRDQSLRRNQHTILEPRLLKRAIEPDLDDSDRT